MSMLSCGWYNGGPCVPISRPRCRIFGLYSPMSRTAAQSDSPPSIST